MIRLDAYEGGANARQEVYTFNYDVKADKEVSIDDLLGELFGILTTQGVMDSTYHARSIISNNI